PNYFLGIASYSGGHIGDSSTFDFTTAPENFWHEWIDEGSGWVFGNGASTDVLSDGDRIGWVFGLAATPVPEPASAMVVAVIGGGAMPTRGRVAAANYKGRYMTRIIAFATLVLSGAPAYAAPWADSCIYTPGTIRSDYQVGTASLGKTASSTGVV